MEHRLNDQSKPGILELVTGILHDATDMISKEMMAARLEMREELGKVKATAMLMGMGAVALMIGGILLALALVYLLQEFSGLELWICYAIVGALISGMGLMVLYVGKQRAAATNLVPTESIEKAKEDARWITRRVKYETR
ncbi:MAG: phage holin family protein [Candidatus Binatia bacterium]